MASRSQKMVFIVVILTIVIPIISTSHIEDLCSQTKRPNECRRIILTTELKRFHNSDDVRAIAEGVADVAISKSKEMYDKLISQYYNSQYSQNDDTLTLQYFSCLENYYNANCNLVMAQRNLDFDEFPDISNEVDLAEEELSNCKRIFGENPGRVGDPNEELDLYLEMVRAAAARLPEYHGEENSSI